MSAIKKLINLKPIDLQIIKIEKLNKMLENQCNDLAIRSFSAIYKQAWNNTFKQKAIAGFQNYLEQFKNNPQDWIFLITQCDTILSGWALFYIDKQKQRVIIEHLSIDPQFWRKGLGKKLIFSLIDYYPKIKSFAVVTRTINNISPKFYTSLGFIKTDFSIAGYTEPMQGYELFL